MNYQYPRRAVPRRETDRIDSSRTVFLSRGPQPHQSRDEGGPFNREVLSGWRTRWNGRLRTRKTGKERNSGAAGEKGDTHRVERGREEGCGDKRREQRSYERVPIRLTVRCRVVGARLAVSLSTCQPTHVGTARRPAPRVDSQTDASRRSHTHA